MNRILFALVLTAFPLPLPVQAGQTPSHEDEGKKPKTFSGEVRYYEPGKRIAIAIRPEVEKTYDLSEKNTTYIIDPGIRVGSKVEMEETSAGNGQKQVTIRIKS